MGSIKRLKVSVEAGHTKDNTKDSGSAGIGNEYKMNVDVKNLVIKKLQALGAIVKDCSLENCNSLIESLAYRSNTSNKFGAKIHLCLHHNAFNGNAHGSEVEYLSTEGAKLAQCIQNEFVKLGFTDRKIQKRNNLYILKHTNAIVCLTEGCFVDSASDMKLYSAEKESDAIVKGLLTYIGDTSALKVNTSVVVNKTKNVVKKVVPQPKNPFTQVLQYGNKGEEVKILQQLLVKKGYKLAVDGDFGEKTKVSVIDYQSKNKLMVDGICGNQTQTSLIK